MVAVLKKVLFSLQLAKTFRLLHIFITAQRITVDNKRKITADNIFPTQGGG